MSPLEGAGRPCRRPLVVVVLAVLLSACGAVSVSYAGGEEGQPADVGAAASPRETPGGGMSPGQTGGAADPVGPPVTIAFAGDVMFEGIMRPQLDADPVRLLDPITPVLRAADLAVVNLETAITERGTAAPKQYSFRAPSSGLVALAAAGVDVASLANNHGLDFGLDGLDDTLAAAADVGLPLIGAGDDAAAAFAPFTADVRGREIAIIGVTDVLDFTDSWSASDDQPGLASSKDHHEARLLEEVRHARTSADTVVVFLHWGVEGEHCPSERQRTLARRLVDAGADILVGGHAHRLQGGGMLDGAFVGYGLGNFVFYSRSGPGTDSGVLTVTVEGRDVLDYTWTPAVLRDGIPHPLEGDAADAASAAWDDLRGCTDLTD